MKDTKPTSGLDNQGQGIHSEKLVKERLLKRGFHLLAQREKFFGVEVDLLVRLPSPHKPRRWLSGLWKGAGGLRNLSESRLWVVEVKSLSAEDWLEVVLRSGQKKRLWRVCDRLAAHYGVSVELILAVVRTSQNFQKTNKNGEDVREAEKSCSLPRIQFFAMERY